jgi:pilus assembly protein CpaD
MNSTTQRSLCSALALSLGFALTACGGMPSNRGVYSLNQPVVERSTVALDVSTTASGLSAGEERRVAAWFEAMDLRFGDKVIVSDPLDRPETRAVVADLAGRYGLLLADSDPAIAGDLAPGQARVTIMRSRASVPNCPNWSARSDANLGNGLTPNYGCATNGNLAAMTANPEDLIKGQKGSPDTYISTSNTSIDAYKAQVGTKANAVGQTKAGGN